VQPAKALQLPPMPAVVPDGSIFISYAHAAPDPEAAVRIVAQLKEAGCLVWLDHERLMCGDQFENHLEDAVKRHCGFFLSLISCNTESRTEAYYHKERRWAAQRAEAMAESRPFYFPVLIDDSPLPARHEPKAFANHDIEHLENGRLSDGFVQRLVELQRRLLGGHA